MVSFVVAVIPGRVELRGVSSRPALDGIVGLDTTSSSTSTQVLHGHLQLSALVEARGDGRAG